MDGLQFISSIVGSLAWPGAVVWLAFLLRAPLAKLIPRVRGLKYGDLHVDIAEQIEAAKEQVQSNPETPEVETAEPPMSFKSLALADPRAAVLSAWLPVEIELNQIAAKSGFNLRPGMPALKQLKVLQEMGILDSFMVQTLVNLRRIRNTAVHITDDNVDFDDAMEMGEMCQWVSEQLRRINTGLAGGE